MIRNAMIVIPLVAYLSASFLFLKKLSMRECAESFLKGHIAVFLFIALSTELLSVFNMVTFSGVLPAWLLLLVACFLSALRRSRRVVLRRTEPLRMTAGEIYLAGAAVFILAAAFASAMLYPPNTWDSMTYHMPRVSHWINNNSVSFYPSSITRQNYQMPLAEFAIMHIQILSGGDLYANLIQWTCFAVLLCIVLLIAGELGLSRNQKILSVFVAATLPMAVLQASSTQNDLVVSCFIASFCLFMIRLGKNLNIENVLFASSSLGLALLAKGTAYLFCAGIGLVLGFFVLTSGKLGCRKLLNAPAALLLVVIMALLLNTGHLRRNYRLYGHPLSTEGERYLNNVRSPMTLASNFLINGAMHLGTPVGPVNRFQLRAWEAVLGPHLNDPDTTWGRSSFIITTHLHEDIAGNLIHIIVIVSVMAVLPVLWRKRRYRQTAWYTAAITAGAVFYCWFMRWQPWASRLHTPLFILSAPLSAVVITSGIGIFRKKFCIFIIF